MLLKGGRYITYSGGGRYITYGYLHYAVGAVTPSCIWQSFCLDALETTASKVHT